MSFRVVLPSLAFHKLGLRLPASSDQIFLCVVVKSTEEECRAYMHSFRQTFKHCIYDNRVAQVLAIQLAKGASTTWHRLHWNIVYAAE